MKIKIAMDRQGIFLNSRCRALIIGSSGAIGSALVSNLKRMIGSNNVVTLSRSQHKLDFMFPETLAKWAAEIDGHFQLILDATGALEINGKGPEKSFSAIQHDQMMDQFMINAVGPAMLIKHFMRFLPRTGKVVFVTLSARVGSITDNRLGGWISYRSSKAALNQIIKTASIEASRKNPQSVFLAIHPGTVISKLTEQYIGNHEFVHPDEAAKNILKVIEQKNSEDTGGFYAYDGKKVPY